MHPTRALTVAYVAISVAAMVVYAFVSPLWQNVIFMVAAWVALVVTMVGLVRATAGNRVPWLLLTLALLAGNMAGLARRVPEWEIGTWATRAGDIAGNLLFLATAMIVVARRGRYDRGGLIEAGIFSAAVGGVVCAVVILPNLAAAHRTPIGEPFFAVTTLLLYGVVGALVRLWQTTRQHRRQLGLLTVVVALWLAGQTALALFDQQTIVFTQICFVGAYTALGLFGADSRAQELAKSGPAPDDHLSSARLVLLGVAIAAMPACAAIPGILGRPVNGVLIAACGTTIALLVMMRIGLVSAQRRNAEKQLQHLAEHDPLTGALNRRGFVTRLREARERNTPAVLAFCDLDGFKEVNDRFGHAAGDDLLVQITRRIRGKLRPADLVGRIGGDEFLVLFVDTPEHALPGVRDRLLNAFEEPFHINGNLLTMTVSIGALAVVPGALTRPNDLVDSADRLMYQAKVAKR